MIYDVKVVTNTNKDAFDIELEQEYGAYQAQGCRVELQFSTAMAGGNYMGVTTRYSVLLIAHTNE